MRQLAHSFKLSQATFWPRLNMLHRLIMLRFMDKWLFLINDSTSTTRVVFFLSFTQVLNFPFANASSILTTVDWIAYPIHQLGLPKSQRGSSQLTVFPLESRKNFEPSVCADPVVSSVGNRIDQAVGIVSDWLPFLCRLFDSDRG